MDNREANALTVTSIKREFSVMVGLPRIARQGEEKR